MAYLEEHDLETVLTGIRSGEDDSLASQKSINVKELRRQLGMIRKQGYAFSSSERIKGVSSVAAPIFDRDNVVIGAISVGGPEPTFTKGKAISQGPLVKETAKQISLLLGFRIQERS